MERNCGVCFAAGTRFVIEPNLDTAIAADFSFVAKDQVTFPLLDGFLRLAPDLILEVSMISDERPDVIAKMKRWIRAGVRLGWELDLKKRILTVYRPDQEPRTVDIDGVIDGKTCCPVSLFRCAACFEC